MAFIPSPNDPFYELMQPPPDETLEQKMAREKRELKAQRHSDTIDNDLKEEGSREKKRKNLIKVLLLGQAESGKSTTLKNFRMKYAKTEWDKERNSWCSVVQLNVVRSIISIQKVVEAEMNGDVPIDLEDDSDLTCFNEEVSEVEALKFTDHHRLLIARLAPLLVVEAELKCRLGAGTDPLPPLLTSMSATPFDAPTDSRLRANPEFSVRSWQDVLDPSLTQTELSSKNTPDTVPSVLAGCRDDMKALWHDKSVRLALKRHRLQLPDSTEFFLNGLDRIASYDYSVTDDDIVHARLRTVGVQEHRLVFGHAPWGNPKAEKNARWEWRIFDVGGCRTVRRAWLPYFDNVNVIIFLAPISVFDQYLEEDSKVNRLEDSLVLWKSICSSKLLAKIQLILFLNKCDLLRRKLKRGIKINQFLPSFGERENEVMSVIKYFRQKFKDIQKQYSPEHRSVYIYPTTVTDTKATATTLEAVRNGVLRENLAASELI